MDGILKAIQSLRGIFAPQKVISPLPASESPGGYNSPLQAGLNYYYQQQNATSQITPQQAQKNIQTSSQPQTIQYPSWMANAPGGPNLASVLGDNTQPTQNAIGQAINMLTKPQKSYAEEYPEGATSYEKQAAPIFDKYGVPPAVGLGVWAMEGRGKTINPNNPYNIGALDTNPQNANAYDFKSPLEGTDEAAKFLAGKSQYQTPAVQKIFKQALTQYKKDHDQVAYLKAIAPTYSTNPQYVQTIIQTPEYQRWSYNTP